MNTSLIKYFRLWVFATLILVSVPTQAQQVPSAFTYVSTSSFFKQHSSSISSWEVQLNKKMRQQAVGSNFELAMPDGEVIVASVKSHKKFHNGDVQLQASFGSDGHVILTMGAAVTYGSITSSTHNHSLSIDELGNAILIDNQTLPANSTDLSDDILVPKVFGAPVKQSSMSRQQLSKLQAQAGSDGKTNIDILFVYSTEFKVLFSSPETQINQLIAFSNASYENSGILINLRAVDAVEIPFNDSDSNSSLLNQARASSGAFDNVAQMRNNVGADLVAVLGSSSPFSASGIAYVLNGFSSASSGFSFTRLSLRCCDTVFAHEIGHNLGSGHEGPLVNPNADIDRCDGGFTGFSCGHGNTSPEVGTPVWGTIMSNISSRAVIGFRFSNSDNTCVGQPCGIAAGLPGPEQAADNRASFNLSRLVVSTFLDEVDTDPTPVTEVEPEITLDPSNDCSFTVIKSESNVIAVVCI